MSDRDRYVDRTLHTMMDQACDEVNKLAGYPFTNVEELMNGEYEALDDRQFSIKIKNGSWSIDVMYIRNHRYPKTMFVWYAEDYQGDGFQIPDTEACSFKVGLDFSNVLVTEWNYRHPNTEQIFQDSKHKTLAGQHSDILDI